jgi:hypothetical protein
MDSAMDWDMVGMVGMVMVSLDHMDWVMQVGAYPLLEDMMLEDTD